MSPILDAHYGYTCPWTDIEVVEFRGQPTFEKLPAIHKSSGDFAVTVECETMAKHNAKLYGAQIRVTRGGTLMEEKLRIYEGFHRAMKSHATAVEALRGLLTIVRSYDEKLPLHLDHDRNLKRPSPNVDIERDKEGGRPAVVGDSNSASVAW
ncbi:hypothetical protein NA57DRAFT_76216 [Rhizodiscina lignyota]|uniref:Uncharacterized protein n=1 Tax=Rhizodiscina lignyota TaxID=1504668 RepID=A0A9P4M5R8_9PEZI|nr:hypothetical protein NA57DRAFT_76216 [Rhizodiscina lignyota]